MESSSQAAPSSEAFQRLQQVQTLSDDEDYVAFDAGVTESEPDTDELIGGGAWGIAAASDDENESSSRVLPDAPVPAPALQRHPAAALAEAHAHLDDTWLFSVSRRACASSAAVAAAASAHQPGRGAPPSRALHPCAAPWAAAGAGEAGHQAALVAPVQPPEPQQQRQQLEEQQEQQQQDEAPRQQRRELGATAANDLDQRLDALFTEFRSGLVSGGAAAAGRAARGGLNPAAGDASDDDLEFLPAQRSVHRGSGHGGGVRFSNVLPPVQDSFPLEYSDGPPSRWRAVLAAGPTAAVRPAAAAAAAAALDALGREAGSQRRHPDSVSDASDDDREFLPARRSVHSGARCGSSSSVRFANVLPPVQDSSRIESSMGAAAGGWGAASGGAAAIRAGSPAGGSALGAAAAEAPSGSSHTRATPASAAAGPRPFSMRQTGDAYDAFTFTLRPARASANPSGRTIQHPFM